MQAQRNSSDPFAQTARALQQASANRGPDVEFYGRIDDPTLRLIPGHNECRPGIRMVEYNVLVVLPVLPEESKGGIILPTEVLNSKEMAYQQARIIDASPVAFNYDDFYSRYPELAPKVGDIVWIARYAGGEVVGKDGRRYRLIKDKDIGGVIEPPGEPSR